MWNSGVFFAGREIKVDGWKGAVGDASYEYRGEGFQNVRIKESANEWLMNGRARFRPSLSEL
jgi:hypothetical protein